MKLLQRTCLATGRREEYLRESDKKILRKYVARAEPSEHVPPLRRPWLIKVFAFLAESQSGGVKQTEAKATVNGFRNTSGFDSSMQIERARVNRSIPPIEATKRWLALNDQTHFG